MSRASVSNSAETCMNDVNDQNIFQVCRVKFQMGQFKSSNLIFRKLKGQFELEGQGHDHQF